MVRIDIKLKAKFWLSSSLHSLHNQNLTPKMANGIFGSPIRRPIWDKKTVLTNNETEY